jgi:helix-hairpin-helix protein
VNFLPYSIGHVLAIDRILAQNCQMRSRFAMTLWIVMFAAAAIGGTPQKPVELVDINRASVQEMLKVPGMTETWAARIARFRPYRTKLDLVEQGVVTPEVYQRIRDGVIAHRMGDIQTVGAGKK